MEPTRRSERTDLENQAGSPFQDVLVGWEGHSPTRRSERTGLSPGRFTLPGYPGWVGRWSPLAEASEPTWKSRPVHPSRMSWLGGNHKSGARGSRLTSGGELEEALMVIGVAEVGGRCVSNRAGSNA